MTSVAASIPADLDRRFGGLARLYGKAGASRIRAAHIVVVGLGGVGSWAAEAAARSGVARLTLVDLDHIAESNINRQVHALDDTLGQAKVQAMRARIAHINPECKVECIEEFVDAANWPEVLELSSTFDSILGSVAVPVPGNDSVNVGLHRPVAGRKPNRAPWLWRCHLQVLRVRKNIRPRSAASR